MIIFYHLFLWLYRVGVFLVSFFNPKARLFIKGRVNVFGKLRKDLKNVSGKIVWMHCASLGEFEQGKPVLKKIMESDPAVVPVISFFSPSGYEIIKKKNEFPFIYYLPMDSVINAQQWMKLVRPSLVLWVKYEYWYFYLQAIKRKKVPLLMISGIYHRNQVFFRWYGGLYRKMLAAFTHFFVQNANSKRYLSTLVDKNKITVSGDTRCDRVIEVANKFQPIIPIEKFIADHKVIVCGSTWEADEVVWIHYVKSHPEINFIIAPHEIDKDNIQFVKSEFENSITWSEWVQLLENNEMQDVSSNCLIIDNIGMLSKLYHYADITYVGGGFGDNGLHNILEAAVYGKPVLFGPVTYKNFEAGELIESGGAEMVNTALELEKVVDDLFMNPELLDKKSQNAKYYVYKNAGASKIILDYLEDRDFL